MKEGEVVIALLPQAEGSLKRRPALILRVMPPFKDYLLCGISTQIHLQVSNFDKIISPADANFANSALKAESLIRLGFLSVFSQYDLIGRIGSISADRHKRLLKNLSDYLVK